MLFSVINLGCKVNRVESDGVAAALVAKGWSESALEAADLVVVNTCTVTGEAEKKTRKAVRHALAANEVAPVVVTGCAAAMTPELYESLNQRVRVVTKLLLNEQVLSIAASLSADTFSSSGEALPVGAGFRTRVGVKVQDGCNHACTYCIVHVARGRSTSRPVADIVAECVSLHKAGVREIVLTGINIGAYSGEHEGHTVGLAELLRTLLEATEGDDAPRFRIGSIEPRDVDEDLIALLKEADGRIARHLHLPLQSGSTKVLREMARPYKAEYFLELVSKLRSQVPSIALSTDIIVGFPGETDADFEETLAVARTAAFMKIHVFPYSMRKGTPAAERTDQISPEVKSSRAARLRALSEELAAEDLASRKGTIELALVEQSGRATLESYNEVEVSPDCSEGSLVPIVLQ